MNVSEVQEAIRSLIRGCGVRRGSHNLLLEGEDTTALFVEVLNQEGFYPTSVDGIGVRPGERIPAFFVEGGFAHFGWIFWEMFSTKRMRKIYGSVEHNNKGDWAIILGRESKKMIYANSVLKEFMDLEHPSEF